MSPCPIPATITITPRAPRKDRNDINASETSYKHTQLGIRLVLYKNALVLHIVSIKFNTLVK